MRGLRTPENEKFLRYWQMILDEAAKQNAVFFADAGECHQLETDDIELEDMSGWLIPNDKADEFEKKWKISNSFNFLEEWADYYLFAEWEIIDGEIKIEFVDYSIDL